jgi:hypothetical protein
MIVSKHVVNIYLIQSFNQNLPLSKEEGICKKENRRVSKKMTIKLELHRIFQKLTEI